jgi:anti-sigma factor RsiW
MTPADELTCKELVEVITEYLEGRLPPPARARFEAHLAGCRGCRAYLQQMRQTIRTLGALTEESISEEGKRELLAAFRTWRHGASTP